MASRAWRAHLRADGAPKDALTREAADQRVQEMTARGLAVEAYLCPFCRSWHVGKRHLPFDQRWTDELRIECGPRVWGCLLAENIGPEHKRLRSLAKRGASALRARPGVLSRPRSDRHLTLALPPKPPPLDGTGKRVRVRGKRVVDRHYP